MYVKFKNFCNRHIMLELPIIKTYFLFDTFNIVFQSDYTLQDHNMQHWALLLLSVWHFNRNSSVKYLCKTCHFSVKRHAFWCRTDSLKHFQPNLGRNSADSELQNASFLIFADISPWQLPKQDIKAILKGLFHKYFICYIMFQFF